MPLDGSADLEEIAKKTREFSGADLKALLYNAQLQSAHQSLENARRVSRASSKAQTDELDSPSQLTPNERRPAIYHSTASGVERDSRHPELEHKVRCHPR